MNKEIWKDIKGYEGLYQVSNFGNVRSVERKHITKNRFSEMERKLQGKLLKISTRQNGYKFIQICKNGKTKSHYIHRLVAQAFIPNIENKPFINHKDGNKENNCVDNLEWCTQKENVLHAYKNKLEIPKRGADNYNAKPILQYDLKGNFVKEWGCITDVAKYYGVSNTCISRVCSGKRKTSCGYVWKYKMMRQDKLEYKETLLIGG